MGSSRALRSYLDQHEASGLKLISKSFWSRRTLLDEFVDKKILSQIDAEVAYEALGGLSKKQESEALVIAFAFSALRQGHLCIEKKENRWIPDLEEVWTFEEGIDVISLRSLLDKGWKKLLKNAPKESPKELPKESLVKVDRNRLYFQRYFIAEKTFENALLSFLDHSKTLDLDQDKIQTLIQGLLDEKKLLKEQANAIFQASKYPLTVLCGGPGTGKTYTAGNLLRALWEGVPKEKKEQFRIALAAPTGKAAGNLESSLAKAVANLEGFPKIQAKTLHSLLKVNPRRAIPYQEQPLIAADVILIDETSMVDVEMMARLFTALKPGCHVVLLGDPFQLPPVEAGSLFADLISSSDHHQISVTMLKKCLRAESKAIIDFSEAIHSGNTQLVFECLDKGEEVGRFNGDKEEIFNYACQKFDLGRSSFQRFCMLTPFRKGDQGLTEWNHRMTRHFIQTAKHDEVSIPILITSNDPANQLFNGDTGVLTLYRPDPNRSFQNVSDQDVAEFVGADGSVRTIAALLLPSYEPAYCVSVHKSQGSEYDEVLLLLPEGSERFGREVFYTAATRAKKKLLIWGENETINETILRTSKRHSGFLSNLN